PRLEQEISDDRPPAERAAPRGLRRRRGRVDRVRGHSARLRDVLRPGGARYNGRMISPALAKAFNAQIGHEFGASLQYVSIAAHFQRSQLTLLANLFFKQAEEERTHAMKFVKYLLDTKGDLKIPATPAPASSFPSAEAAVAAALKWEQEGTGQITALMELAEKDNNYLAQSVLPC